MILTKEKRRAHIQAAADALGALVNTDDIVEETVTLIELDVGDGTNWIARFSCGLITVNCGDLSCELAFDDVESWKTVALRMIQGMYWMSQTGVG